MQKKDRGETRRNCEEEGKMRDRVMWAGKELEFYIKKMQKGKKGKAAKE